MAHGLRRCGLRVVALALAALMSWAGGGMTAAARPGPPTRAPRARGTRALNKDARVGVEEKPDSRSEIGGLQSKFVDVNGVQARYYEAGAGEPMVMIHGGFTAGSSTANVFSRNIEGLAKRFHVFAVDRLASGMSGNPLKDDDYTYQGDVDFIYGFIQTLNLGRCTWWDIRRAGRLRCIWRSSMRKPPRR